MNTLPLTWAFDDGVLNVTTSQLGNDITKGYEYIKDTDKLESVDGSITLSRNPEPKED